MIFPKSRESRCLRKQRLACFLAASKLIPLEKRRVVRSFITAALAFLLCAATADAYLPYTTSPVLGYRDRIRTFTQPTDQHRVGDGNFHDLGCDPTGPPPDYGCFCPIVPILVAPIARLYGNTLEVESFVKNAYCNSAWDQNPNIPNATNYWISVVQISPEDVVSTFVDFDPYWEHGKVFFTIPSNLACYRFQAVFIKQITFNQQAFAGSEIVGPIGQEPSGRSCLDDRRTCPLPTNVAQPINVGSGNMRYEENLFAATQNARPLVLELAYNSRHTAAGSLGPGFTHTFEQTMKLVGGNPRRIQWINAKGEKTIFYAGNPGVDTFLAVWPADAAETVFLAGGIYTLTDLDGTITKFGSTAGEWQSTEDRWGNRIFGTYISGKLTSLTDPENRVWSLVNDPTSGKLTSLTDPESRVWNFAYDGSGRLQSIRDPLHPIGNPWRQFLYVTGNPSEPSVLAQVQDDALAVLEGHQYDMAGRAISSWSGDTVVQAGVPQPGTNARSLVTLVYNSATQSTVTTKIDATTNSVSTFTLTAPAGRFLPLSISGACPSCGAGADLQTFTYDEFNRVLSKTVGSLPENVQTTFVHNLNGMLTTKTEAVGKPEERITTYAYGKADWPSFVTQMQEPSVGNPGNFRTTTNTWATTGTCAGFTGETCLQSSVFGYVPATPPPPTSETHTTTTKFDSKHRVTSVTGPVSGQLTSMTYYSDTDTTTNRRGRLSASILQTSATPTSLTTTFDDYDLFGTARKVTDPNSVDTVRTTDAKGRVTSVVSKKPVFDAAEPADYTTSYVYDSRDRLTELVPPRMNLMPPSGGKTRFQYEDGSNRLTDTIRVDSSGNQQERLHLTLNVIGGKTKEEAQTCTSPANPCLAGNWVTKRSDDFTYEIHNRLSAIVHPVGGRVDYTYDTRGNLIGVKDERHTADPSPNVVYVYDGLDRLISVTQKRTISPGTPVTTSYLYDKQDNLTRVTDPKTNQTNYEYDDFGQMRKQDSPVSGITTYSYDLAGNLTSSTDANGAVTTRTYDAANRILTATSIRSGLPTEIVSYSYDAGEPPDELHPPSPPTPHPKRYGKGRLTSMTDPSGSTHFAYERRGLLKKEWKTIDSNTYGIQVGHDANGNRTGIRYPSGRLVTYGYDFSDRPSSATSPGATFVSSVVYQPFGPVSQIDYGNGTSKTMTFDLRYRPMTNKLMKSPTTISQQTFGLDGVGNITSITDLDAAYSRSSLVYDDLDRLTGANTSSPPLWGAGSYTYDDLGNVNPSLTMGSRTATFSYSGTTPKLTSVNESGVGVRAVTYDAAGNETVVGAATFVYSARNFLASADNLTYTYDGRGLRVATTLTSTIFPISLSINPVSVVKGSPATGTVTLNSGAPVGGAAVTLKSSDTAAATVPASVTVPQNQTSQTFSITTQASLTADAKVVISASYGNVTKSEALTITTTPRLSLVSISPRTVQGGTPATGTVTLSGLSSGTSNITLTSSAPTVASVPASVGVLNGQTSANFSVTTFAVSASQAVTITATYLGVSRWASVTVVPFAVKGFGVEEHLAWSSDRPSTLRLASLTPSGTRGLLLGFVREKDFDPLTDEGFSLGLTAGFSEEPGAGVLRTLDGPIYSVPGSPKRNYIYSPEMNLLAESELSSARDRSILYEYVWFNGQPVAQVDGANVTHWTFTDHLGTPTIQTDAAGTVFWRVEYEPYGRVFAKRPTGLADQHQPLRLPGQEAEQFNLDLNGLTERSYNVFRWYRGNWGRYTQPDPLLARQGFQGPLLGSEDEVRYRTDLYSYVDDNPVMTTDPSGLSKRKERCVTAASNLVGILRHGKHHQETGQTQVAICAQLRHYWESFKENNCSVYYPSIPRQVQDYLDRFCGPCPPPSPAWEPEPESVPDSFFAPVPIPVMPLPLLPFPGPMPIPVPIPI